jgi:predicted transcriptional regulator
MDIMQSLKWMRGKKMKDEFIKMAAEVVTANTTGRGMSTEQIVEMIKSVAGTLEGLSGVPVTETALIEEKPALSWQQSIGKNSITCLICGFKGTTLNAHIRRKHNLTNKDYYSQFGIPNKTALVSKAYSAKRSKMAKDSGLGEHLQRAREAKKEAAGPQESSTPAKPKAGKKSKKETSPVKE